MYCLSLRCRWLRRLLPCLPAYTVCACLAAPALFWLFAPDTPYTTAYMDAPVGALFAAALCVILLPCAANSRVQRGLALAFLCGALTTVKEIGTVFALCVVGIWFLQCLLDALRDKGGILRGFLLPFTAALPCFAIPLAWKLLLKALHRADDQFSSMGPGYFLQCWQEARTGFDRYFYDVWDRYYARLRSYPLLFGASTFKVGCLCAAAAVLLLIVLIWAMGRWQGLRTALPGLCMILYWPLYQGVLFYVYICGMSPYEALEMASWERYFCCFFLGWFSVLRPTACREWLGMRCPPLFPACWFAARFGASGKRAVLHPSSACRKPTGAPSSNRSLQTC